MSQLQLDTGVTLFYTDEGVPDAPVLLFVHGWSCDSHDWSWQLPEFGRTHRVIAVDLRGHGRSSQADSGYAMTAFADDLAELARRLQITSLIGVGHSMGAMVLTELAIAQPALVRALALMDPAYGAPDEVATQTEAALPLLRGTEDMAPYRANIEALEGPKAPAHLITWHIRRMLGTPRAAVIGAFEEMLVAPGAWATCSRAEAKLAGRHCPVLSIYGSARADAAAWEGAHDPRARAELLDAGHWVHQECPDEVNRLVRDWLEALPAD